jgi:hypothetical protein
MDVQQRLAPVRSDGELSAERVMETYWTFAREILRA